MSQRNERSTPPELDGVSHWLIHHAARRAPQSLSSRLEEEWLADLGSRSSALSRLRFAVGCCWATVVIVNDGPTRVPAASPAAAARGFIALTDRSIGYFSLRSGTLFLIAGLHAALFFGLITTLSHTRGPLSPPILENQTLEDVPRKKEPVLQSLTKDWTISVPKPDLEVPPLRVPSDEAATGVVKEPTEPYLPPPTPLVPTHVIARLAGGPGAGFPDTADFYPSLSIRLEEQGISTVRVCVDNHGRLTSDPTTVKGSGSTRLDDGALKLARAGSGHYRATTEDGQPVNSCYPIGIRFQLKK